MRPGVTYIRDERRENHAIAAFSSLPFPTAVRSGSICFGRPHQLGRAPGFKRGLVAQEVGASRPRPEPVIGCEYRLRADRPLGKSTTCVAARD